MKTRFLFWWDLLREQLWFIPTLICGLSFVVAVGTLWLDSHYGLGTSDRFFPSFETTSGSARTVLGSLIGALVTVLGLVFSVTMLSVSLTTSQYGPRLVRLLFDSNVTQNTLGIFLGTIVYSMVVLRSIRDPDPADSAFTPHLSIMIAEVACGICVLVLLTFINHLTQRMRAETLIKSIYSDVLGTVDRLFPESAVVPEDDSAEVVDAQLEGVSWQDAFRLESDSTGYLQAIDLTRLVAKAKQDNAQVQVCVKPGEFIHEGTRLAHISAEWPDEARAKQCLTAYAPHFLIGPVRTPRQDVEAGILELVEAGVRALSPGINDPMTAINVIDYLGAILRRLARRSWPSEVIADAEGNPRAIVCTTSFPSLLAAAMNQLRQNARGSVAVYCRLLECLAAVAQVAVRGDDQQALHLQSEMILADAQNTLHEPNDLRDIRERQEQIVAIVDERAKSLD